MAGGPGEVFPFLYDQTFFLFEITEVAPRS